MFGVNAEVLFYFSFQKGNVCIYIGIYKYLAVLSLHEQFFTWRFPYLLWKHDGGVVMFSHWTGVIRFVFFVNKTFYVFNWHPGEKKTNAFVHKSVNVIQVSIMKSLVCVPDECVAKECSNYVFILNSVFFCSTRSSNLCVDAAVSSFFFLHSLHFHFEMNALKRVHMNVFLCFFSPDINTSNAWTCVWSTCWSPVTALIYYRG